MAAAALPAEGDCWDALQPPTPPAAPAQQAWPYKVPAAAFDSDSQLPSSTLASSSVRPPSGRCCSGALSVASDLNAAAGRQHAAGLLLARDDCGGAAEWLGGAPRPGWAATLELEGRLGAGGPGAGLTLGAAVFRGRWHRAPAAIKVCYCGPHHQAPGRVMEMAVLGAVRHPNIPALYACYTDVAAEGLGAAPLLADPSPRAAPALLHLRPLAPAADAGTRCISWPLAAPESAACDVIVTEYCDRGTLAAALASGALDMATACCLLLDVAAALACLHGLRMSHGSVNAESVLLKTEALRPGGLVAKLSGLSSCRLHDARGRPLHLRVSSGAFESDGGAASLAGDDDAGAGSDAGSGAAPHGLSALLAPGCDGEDGNDGDGGCAWSGPAEDVHAFGSLMWRVFSGLKACGAGAGASPGGVAPWAAALCAACWAPNPRDRPAIWDAARALEGAAALAVDSDLFSAEWFGAAQMRGPAQRGPALGVARQRPAWPGPAQPPQSHEVTRPPGGA